MTTLLTLPIDVLEQIVIMTASPSLADMLHLLLTCRILYQSLSVTANPHIYASISRRLFDTPFIRQGVPPDSSIAAECVRRLRLTRRIRRGDQTAQNLLTDLWTAYGLVLEGGSLNASQLSSAGFSGYIEDVVRVYCALTEDEPREAHTRDLAIWLLALTITRDDILRMCEEGRERLLEVLRPIVMRKRSFPEDNNAPNGTAPHVLADESTSNVVFYGREQDPQPKCPPVSSAVVTLCFALGQVYTQQEPVNLPENRAAALAQNRSGPTRQDVQAMASFKTPLFAEAKKARSFGSNQSSASGFSAPFHRDRYHDPLLHQLYLPEIPPASVYGYIQENLTGVWEGSSLFAPFRTPDDLPSSRGSDIRDFVAQIPMQCAVSVHLLFTPSLPVTWGHMDGDNPLHWDVNHQRLCGGISMKYDTQLRANHTRNNESQHNSLSQSTAPRHPDEAIDCIIVAQTLSDHDEAWGAYNFYGRVLRDGKIVMRREAKWDQATLPSHVFEGYLHYNESWVGTLRTCDEPNPSSTGIFSMRKRDIEKGER